jgi:hypothetical protein
MSPQQLNTNTNTTSPMPQQQQQQHQQQTPITGGDFYRPHNSPQQVPPPSTPNSNVSYTGGQQNNNEPLFEFVGDA